MVTRPCNDCSEPVSSIAYKCPHCMRVTFLGGLNNRLAGEFTLFLLILLLWKFA